MKKYFTAPRLVCLLVALALSAAANASPSNKWRLQFSGGAESDGEIVIHFTPDDGEDVLVKKRMGAASFGVDIISVTVKDVRINPEKE